jgi:serine/threonine protein phosphatase PrpC
MSKTDEQLRLVGASDTGTTCCLAFVRRDGQKRICSVANLGDTRAVVSLDGNAKRVTVDHKPTTPSEIDRIKYDNKYIERKEELLIREECLDNLR